MQALQHRGGGLAVGVADGDRFGDPAGTVEKVARLERADHPLRTGQLPQPGHLEVDVPLGELKIVEAAEQCGEHPGRMVLRMGFEVGEGGAVQVFDPPRYLGRGEIGQSEAFTVEAPGPPRHAVVPERPWGAGWW